MAIQFILCPHRKRCCRDRYSAPKEKTATEETKAVISAATNNDAAKAAPANRPDKMTNSSIQVTSIRGAGVMTGNDAEKLPSDKELDELVGSAPFSGECSVLCSSLLQAIEDLQGATGIARLRLVALIRALRARMRALHCALCLPE